MTVEALQSTFPLMRVTGDSAVVIRGVAIDSREVEAGDLFVAVQGEKSDGRKFIPQALAKGASAILAEGDVDGLTVPVLELAGVRDHLGSISAKVYGDPSEKMSVVGVTGTNGKTTTSLLIEGLLNALAGKTGYMGTLSYRWPGFEVEAPRTTPEACDVHKMLGRMLDAGARHAVMECSSHGIELGRLNAVAFDVAVFTNLTQDHLDFHGTMDRYGKAKEKLFTALLASSSKSGKCAVINADDDVGAKWAKELPYPVLRYAVDRRDVEIFPKDVDMVPEGIRAIVTVQGKEVELRSELVGKHNLYNLLAALSVGHALGFSLSKACDALAGIKVIPGRLERVPNDKGIHVFVDYAHTDDALKNVISALRSFHARKLIVVFGCGGDRDRTKRPKMAKVVTEMADVAVMTSDNPRTEDPLSILREIEIGASPRMKRVAPASLDRTKTSVFSIEVDRRAAISAAIGVAGPGDIVLIAGKGHETYQEVMGVKQAFDDRVVAREVLRGEAN